MLDGSYYSKKIKFVKTVDGRGRSTTIAIAIGPLWPYTLDYERRDSRDY